MLCSSPVVFLGEKRRKWGFMGEVLVRLGGVVRVPVAGCVARWVLWLKTTNNNNNSNNPFMVVQAFSLWFVLIIFCQSSIRNTPSVLFFWPYENPFGWLAAFGTVFIYVHYLLFVRADNVLVLYIQLFVKDLRVRASLATPEPGRALCLSPWWLLLVRHFGEHFLTCIFKFKEWLKREWLKHLARQQQMFPKSSVPGLTPDYRRTPFYFCETVIRQHSCQSPQCLKRTMLAATYRFIPFHVKSALAVNVIPKLTR